VKVVAFAGDLAILMTMNREERIEMRINEYMNKVAKWCANTGMRIANEKPK
jgi:hypothetical protein